MGGMYTDVGLQFQIYAELIDDSLLRLGDLRHMESWQWPK